MIDENIDTLDYDDLGAADLPFKPPKINNLGGAGGVGQTFDQNQTIKLGPGAEDSLAIHGPGGVSILRGPGGANDVNDTNNETLGGIMFMMNKEPN